MSRCQAAFAHDLTACEGALDAVVIVDDASGTSLPACVHHAALLLAFVSSAYARTGRIAGAADRAAELARTRVYRQLATAVHRSVPLREFIRLFFGAPVTLDGDAP